MKVYLIGHGLAMDNCNYSGGIPVHFYCPYNETFGATDNNKVISGNKVPEKESGATKEHLLIGERGIFGEGVPDYVTLNKATWDKNTVRLEEKYSFLLMLDKKDDKAYVIPFTYYVAFGLSWLVKKVTEHIQKEGCTVSEFHWLACRSAIQETEGEDIKHKSENKGYGNLIVIDKVVL